MTLSFRAFDSEKELESQRSLFRICFPEAVGYPPETLEHYQWKFRSYPDSVPSYEFAAYTPEGDMVGYYAAIPFRYKVGSLLYKCGMVCDVMTSPAMRGQGVFTKLGRYSLDAFAEKDLDFTLGYPVRQEVIPGHLKVGWKIAFELPVYLFPIRSNSLLSSKGLNWLSLVGNLLVRFWRTFFYLLNPLSGTAVAQRYDVDGLLSLPDFPGFLEQWIQNSPNALVKTVPFVRWRLSAPSAKYTAICIRDSGGQLVQVAIVRVAKLQGVPSLCVLDWMCLGKARPFSLACHRALLSLAKQDNCEVIATMMSRTSANERSLGYFGYLKTPARFKLIIKSLRDGLPLDQLFDETKWGLMWIDSDDL